MADVFISYKSERRPAARHLADIIAAHGFSVWFDYARDAGLVPGHDFGRHIESELRQAKAVVVLWCPLSVDSGWVRNEAALARQLGRFLPAQIAACNIPLQFFSDDYVDITGWDGDPGTRSLDRLIDRIEALVGREAVIGRRRLVDLHSAWVNYGRPNLVKFELAPRLEIQDAGLAGMPAQPAPPAFDPAAARLAIAAQEWPAVRDSRDVGRLQRFEQHFAGTYFADEAKALLEAIEAEVRRAQALAEARAEQRRREQEAAAQAEEARRHAEAEKHQRFQAEGRIRLDVQHVYGAPEGWFKPGNGKTEWFQDHPAGPQMVVVPAGRFIMGSNDHDWEKPPHEVTIAEPFAVGRFAVTFAEWDAAQADPDWQRLSGIAPRKPVDQGWGRGTLPVIDVNWHDAKAYCAWLSGVTDRTYRLLSEAEWEYVCRAGSRTQFWWGDAISTDQANYNGNHTYGNGAKGKYRERTMPVESFAANPWGLWQVHGNVMEWCEDNWHPNYQGAPTDGSVRSGGDESLRVLRGGSCGSNPGLLRSAYRFDILGRVQPSFRSSWVGVRLARTL